MGLEDEINTCIGCNQACLDFTFQGERSSCLVNPSAGYEIDMEEKAVEAGKREKIAVVGAGPAGLAFSPLPLDEDTMLHFLKCQTKLVVNLIWQNKFLEKKSFTRH